MASPETSPPLGFTVARHDTALPWQGEWDTAGEYALPDTASVWQALAGGSGGLDEGDLVCVFREEAPGMSFGYVRGTVRPLPLFGDREPLTGLVAAWIDRRWGVSSNAWADAWAECSGAAWLLRLVSYTTFPRRRLATALVSLAERAWPTPTTANLREALAEATAWRDGDPGAAARAQALHDRIVADGGEGDDLAERNAAYVLSRLPGQVDKGLAEWFGQLDDTLDFADEALSAREGPGTAANWLRATHLPLRALLDALTEDP